MDPTFGSFGDFLSIAALIKDIVEALNDSRGSSKKYQELINGLGILNTAIEQVKKLGTSQRFLVDIERTLVTALEQAVAKVWQSLEDFHIKTRKYSASLSPGGSGNGFKDGIRKIQYRLQEKDVQDFQQEILGYKTSLELLLELAQMHINQRNHDELVSQNDRNKNVLYEQIRMMQGSWRRIGGAVLGRLDSISTLGTEILSVILTTSTGIREIQPIITEIHSFIMRLERPLSDPHFVLEDAMGDSRPIYMKTITSWDAFEFVVQQWFKGKRGARRVRRGRYVLEDPSTGIILDRTWDWEELFMRRQRIYMRLFCKEVISKVNDEKLSRCPWCETMWSSRDDEDVPCLKCKRSFTRLFDIDNDCAMENPSSRAKSPPGQPGQPVLGARPSQETRKSDRFLKHAKGDGHDRAASMDSDFDSESDEEDIKCFDRIILISQRTRTMPPRPRAIRPPSLREASASSKAPVIERATEADARQYAIPPGYSLKNWDPSEEPIVLLGSVFDGDSLGKWIYDWTIYSYGSSADITELASDLWLLLIQLTGKMKRTEETLPLINKMEDKEMLEDFIESGDRLLDKLRLLLKRCERPMLETSTKKGQKQLGNDSGVAFVETLFGRERELERTERFMQSVRLWNLRFDTNCEDLVKTTGPSPQSRRPTTIRPRLPASISSSRLRDSQESRTTHYRARPPSPLYPASDRSYAEYGANHPRARKTTGYSYAFYEDSPKRPATRARFRATQGPYSYYIESVPPTEDEYVQVNGVTYMIPARNDPSRTRYERDGFSYNRNEPRSTQDVGSPRPQTQRRETRVRDVSPAPGSNERGSAPDGGQPSPQSAGISEICHQNKSSAKGPPEDTGQGESLDDNRPDGRAGGEEAPGNKVVESLREETSPWAHSDNRDLDALGTNGDNGSCKDGVEGLQQKTPVEETWDFGLVGKKKKKKKKTSTSFSWLGDGNEEELKHGDSKHDSPGAERSDQVVEKVVEDFQKETSVDSWEAFKSAKKKRKKKAPLAFTWGEDEVEDEPKNIDGKHDNTGGEGLSTGNGNVGKHDTVADGFCNSWSAWTGWDTKKVRKDKAEKSSATTTAAQHTQDHEDEAHAPDAAAGTANANPVMDGAVSVDLGLRDVNDQQHVQNDGGVC